MQLRCFSFHFVSSLAFEGRILTIGYTSGQIPKIPANLLLVKSCSAIGVYWGDYKQRKPDDFVKSIDDCILHINKGNIEPFVGEQLPLSQVKLIFSSKSSGSIFRHFVVNHSKIIS